jgi:hypothetical protein
MKLERHATAVGFLARTQGMLETAEAENNLILGVALRARDAPNRFKHPPYFATVRKGGEVVSAAVVTPPHGAILWTAGDAPDAALHLLAQDLRRSGSSTSGVIGPKESAWRFARIWRERSGEAAKPKADLRSYRLDQVLSLELAAGWLRAAREEDAPLATRWIAAFQAEALGEVENGQTAEFALAKIRDGDLFLWQDGEPVSMAAKARPTRHGITVNLVYTPPTLRGHGYATACVASLSQRLLDSGRRFCTLFANLANPVSNRVYERIGYRPIGDFAELTFRAAGRGEQDEPPEPGEGNVAEKGVGLPFTLGRRRRGKVDPPTGRR